MAHKVFHRSLTAGIALAGAGAIALSTVPVLPSHEVVAAPRVVTSEVHVTAPRVMTTEVEYASLVRSLELLIDGAVGALGQSFAAFTTQIPALINYVGIGVEGGPWADPDLLPWNHSLLLGATLFAPVAPLFVGPFTDAVVEVLAKSFPSRENEIRENLTQTADYLFARLVGPIVSALGATGAVHQEYYRAGMEGNPPGQWLALLSAPIHIIDGFFNGGYGDLSPLLTGTIGGPRIAAPGLFTPWGKYPVDRTVSDVFPDLPTGETAPASPNAQRQAATKQVAADPAAEVTADEGADAGTDEGTAEIVVTPVADVVSDETEPADPVVVEKTDEVEKVDGTEKTDEVEKVDGTEKTDGAEEADGAEKAEKSEAPEKSEKSAKAEKSETTEKSEKTRGGSE